MFGQQFSSSCYSSEFQLEEYNGERTIIDRKRFYRTGAMTERIEPLMIKVGTTHLPVYPSTTVPYDIMAIPKEESKDMDESLPTEKPVLIPKEQKETHNLF